MFKSIKSYISQRAFLLLFVLSASCTSKKSTNVIIKPPLVFTLSSTSSSEFDTKFIADEVDKFGKSISFFCGIENLYGKEYFIYLDNADSLTFIHLQSKRVIKKFLGNITSKMGEYYLSRISGNKLHLLSRENKYFYEFVIDENFIPILKKEYNLNVTGKLDRIRFLTYPEATRFLLTNSSLYINYAKGNQKNLIDKNAILYFNLSDTALDPKFIVDYPVNYHKDRIENKELLFEILNDSCLAFAYMQHDNIGIYDVINNTSRISNIIHDCKFLTFDENKNKNLGYVAKYLLTNEGNYKLFCDSLKLIYLFKKLGKSYKKESTKIECYVFDINLNPFKFFKLNQNVCQSYIYKFQSGFLAFNDSLKKAFYYEFN
jgi:hypothetical protein